MTSKIVQDWFAGDFEKLAPELQSLHQHGGSLFGNIDITLGTGIAGFIGRRLIKKLNIPNKSNCGLVVNISHSQNHLHWDRTFDSSHEMKSTFEPVNTIKDGYWIEKTGPIKIRLTVDIKDHGWHWRVLRIYFYGVPLPTWLFPETTAYKRIENEAYRFYVGFKAPLIGLVLSYSGLLQKQ